MKFFFYSLLILCLWLGIAQAERYYFTGIIGDGLSFQMQLDIDGQKVSGHYYYDMIGEPIRLEGLRDSAERLTLREYIADSGESSGLFQGNLSSSLTDYADTFTGEWISLQGNVFNFRLNKVAEFVHFSIEQNRIQIKSTYPFFTSPTLQVVNQALQETFIQRQTDFLRQGQELAVAGELFSAWAFDCDIRISYSSPDFISILENIYVYTGGAHPNTGFAVHNLLLEANGVRRLELQDMFRRGVNYSSLLSPLILDELRQQDAAWVLDGSVSFLAHSDLSQFTISPVGMTFYFEPYAVGPYVQGSFQVTLAFETLLELIDEGSPLWRFL